MTNSGTKSDDEVDTFDVPPRYLFLVFRYSYTTGEFPFIERVQNHCGVPPEVLVANHEGEIFTLSTIHGVVTSNVRQIALCKENHE